MSHPETCVVPEDLTGQRLDKVLAQLYPDLSRARLQSLLAEGAVALDGETGMKASLKLKGGETLLLVIPEAVPDEPEAQNITLDIVFEDEHILVLNKPVGLVVHPAAGHAQGTLVNALLHHCGDSLSGIGGVKRPGIVHRLDKDTSGLMVVAKHDKAHQGLAAQLADKSMGRIYHALTLNVPIPPLGKIDKPLGRHPHNRLKQSILRQGGREAVTNYRLLESFADSFSLIECRLETGRTHQIRVHLEDKKVPIIGDPLYGPQTTALKGKLTGLSLAQKDELTVLQFVRQALHAHNLYLVHPITYDEMHFEAPYPDDFSALYQALKKL
ncbi:MAG: RluA family pseudouridine synthase [Pseudobdellovibrionaceae bacterium]